MSAKERAVEIYQQHIALASTDGRLFRKTVMDQLMEETGCSLAAAATHYNNAKKASPVEGLGRPAVSKNVRKPSAGKGKQIDEIPDNECFSIVEVVKCGNDTTVGRCHSFAMQGEASESFDAKVKEWPNTTWVFIQGLGPNPGDTFKLEPGEKEIKRHVPTKTVTNIMTGKPVDIPEDTPHCCDPSTEQYWSM